MKHTLVEEEKEEKVEEAKIKEWFWEDLKILGVIT